MTSDPRFRGGPAYAAIAGHYAEKIRSGELVADAQLPSTRDMAEEWGVSSVVVRQAVAQLRGDGLVYGIRGKGVFVSPAPGLTRIAPARYRKGRSGRTFNDEAAAAGAEVTTDTHTVQIPASSDIAERLGIAPGDMVSDTEYIIRMDGLPVTHSHAYEPLELTRGTLIEWPNDGQYGHLGIADRFDVIGQAVVEVEEALTFRGPTPIERAALQISPNTGVIAIAQTFRTSERAVEVADISYPADRYRFIYRMPVPAAPDVASSGA